MSCITYQGRAGGVHPMIIMREEESCMTRFKEQAMKIVFMVAACASVLAVFLICLFLFANGILTRNSLETIQ